MLGQSLPGLQQHAGNLAVQRSLKVVEQPGPSPRPASRQPSPAPPSRPGGPSPSQDQSQRPGLTGWWDALPAALWTAIKTVAHGSDGPDGTAARIDGVVTAAQTRKAEIEAHLGRPLEPLDWLAVAVATFADVGQLAPYLEAQTGRRLFARELTPDELATLQAELVATGVVQTALYVLTRGVAGRSGAAEVGAGRAAAPHQLPGSRVVTAKGTATGPWLPVEQPTSVASHPRTPAPEPAITSIGGTPQRPAGPPALLLAPPAPRPSTAPAISSAPAGPTPLESTALASSPLASSPLESVPLESVPPESAPLESAHPLACLVEPANDNAGITGLADWDGVDQEFDEERADSDAEFDYQVAAGAEGTEQILAGSRRRVGKTKTARLRAVGKKVTRPATTRPGLPRSDVDQLKFVGPDPIQRPTQPSEHLTTAELDELETALDELARRPTGPQSMTGASPPTSGALAPTDRPGPEPQPAASWVRPERVDPQVWTSLFSSVRAELARVADRSQLARRALALMDAGRVLPIDRETVESRIGPHAWIEAVENPDDQAFTDLRTGLILLDPYLADPKAAAVSVGHEVIHTTQLDRGVLPDPDAPGSLPVEFEAFTAQRDLELLILGWSELPGGDAELARYIEIKYGRSARQALARLHHEIVTSTGRQPAQLRPFDPDAARQAGLPADQLAERTREADLLARWQEVTAAVERWSSADFDAEAAARKFRIDIARYFAELEATER